MWFKVTKDFGMLKVGDVIELKEDAQHQVLVDAGKLEETEAPESAVKNEVSADSIYSVGTVLIDDTENNQIDEPSAKGKPGRKPKSE